MNESISAVTPVALWWTGDDIEIYEIDGELVALYGWNGEQWTDCWRCTDRYTAADDERLTVRPTYRGQVEACDDEDAAELRWRTQAKNEKSEKTQAYSRERRKNEN